MNWKKAACILLLPLIIAVLPFPLSAQTVTCNDSLWNHVFYKDRLKVKIPCTYITGHVVSILRAPDGDYHIRVKLDPVQDSAVAKIVGNKRSIIVEPVCIKKPWLKRAVMPCSNYQNKVFIPKRRQRIKVTGPLVWDSTHGWYEIHPVNSIEALPKQRK